jgi:hypothetical protein
MHAQISRTIPIINAPNSKLKQQQNFLMLILDVSELILKTWLNYYHYLLKIIEVVIDCNFKLFFSYTFL